jgi:hypothetical protein
MSHLLPPSNEDTDPALCEALRQLGRRFGPLTVAKAAAGYTDPNVLMAAIETASQVQRDAVTDELPDAYRPEPQ